MKSYFILDCPNLKQIANNLYEFLIRNNSLNKVNFFWNPLTRDEIKQIYHGNTALIKWFDDLNVRIRDIAFTCWSDTVATAPHIDEPPVIAKINIPVLNTKDTYNVWWDNDGNEIDRVECITPIVLRSDIPHGVILGQTHKKPRLQFSFCFYDEPISYLGPTKEEEQQARKTFYKRFKKYGTCTLEEALRAKKF
jgi:hypothetical protein